MERLTEKIAEIDETVPELPFKDVVRGPGDYKSPSTSFPGQVELTFPQGLSDIPRRAFLKGSDPVQGILTPVPCVASDTERV